MGQDDQISPLLAPSPLLDSLSVTLLSCARSQEATGISIAMPQPRCYLPPRDTHQTIRRPVEPGCVSGAGRRTHPAAAGGGVALVGGRHDGAGTGSRWTAGRDRREPNRTKGLERFSKKIPFFSALLDATRRNSLTVRQPPKSIVYQGFSCFQWFIPVRIMRAAMAWKAVPAS